MKTVDEAIKFVPHGHKFKNLAEVKLEFNVNDGFYDAVLVVAGVSVAYLSNFDGALTLLPIEVYDMCPSKQESLRELKKLQDIGFQFDEVELTGGRKEYYLKVEGGRNYNNKKDK